MRYAPIAFIALLFVCVAAACGGGSSGGGTTVTSPTAPTTTTITIADAAPMLGQEVATTVNAALRAGTAASPQPGTLAAIWQLLVPTLHAQSNFAANCSRGGNVNIRYTGSRPVVLAGTSVVFSNCAVSIRNRDVRFNADLNSNGYWTAQDPGPVTLNGTLNVEEIGAQLLSGSVTDTRFGGTVGGLTVGTPDTAPPPSPNTCPGTWTRNGAPFSSIVDAPVNGFTYIITVSVGATCPWSVTTQPGFVSVNPLGGRGTTTFGVTVSANTGAARSGSLTINGTNIPISQLGTATTTTPPPTTPAPTPTPTPTPSPSPTPPSPPTGTQADTVGQWCGTVSVNQPCGQLFPASYTWRATITRSGSAYSMALFTTFSFETRNIPVPAVGADRSFEFNWNDPEIDLILHLRATFAADFQSLSGTVASTIICNPSNPPQALSGTWQGRRTGS